MKLSFNIGHIERSILAILHTSYNMGSKSTGGAFSAGGRSGTHCLCIHIIIQVNLKIVNCGGAYRDCIKRHGDKT